MSVIHTAMLFSPKRCIYRELLRSPKYRNPNRNFNKHQCISKMGPNKLKLICELKIKLFFQLRLTTLQI